MSPQQDPLWPAWGKPRGSLQPAPKSPHMRHVGQASPGERSSHGVATQHSAPMGVQGLRRHGVLVSSLILSTCVRLAASSSDRKGPAGTGLQVRAQLAGSCTGEHPTCSLDHARVTTQHDTAQCTSSPVTDSPRLPSAQGCRCWHLRLAPLASGTHGHCGKPSSGTGAHARVHGGDGHIRAHVTA